MHWILFANTTCELNKKSGIVKISTKKIMDDNKSDSGNSWKNSINSREIVRRIVTDRKRTY